MPKISHDISIILYTIPATTSKKIRTHIWGYASLPPSWLYTAYTVPPIVRPRFSNPQHPEPAESTQSLSKRSNHIMGRINVEP